MTDRREFIKQAGVAAAGIAVAPAFVSGLIATPRPVQARAFQMDAVVRDLLMEALNTAKVAGAAYADARISHSQQSSIQTRERQIVSVTGSDTIGCGVRALVDGCWGFSATDRLTRDGVAGAAKEAVAIARASRVARDLRVELAPAPSVGDVTWQSDYQIDPWDISLDEKTSLLLAANAEALKVRNIRFVNTGFAFVKDERNFANTDGSVIAQRIVRSNPDVSITAVSPDRSDFQNRGPVIAPPMGRGWEYIKEIDLLTAVPRWADETAQMLQAKPVEVGRYDLLLHPTHLFLTIHESIGHSTELDRAMGYEANYAGTSFVSPPNSVLGSLKIGSDLMNIEGDRSQKGALSTMGYDDEGVKPDDFPIIQNGVFRDYQTTREQASWLKWWYDANRQPTRSHGCSYAQSWSAVQFQRMPNVSLLPSEKNTTWDDMVAATDNGIAIFGRGSYSIDQQRYNAQFGGQVFYEIKKGKITGMLKDVAYQMRTPDFWNAMDLIGGPSTYELNGTFNDGKGQPSQSNAVTHGCVPARFKQQNVINTGRQR